RHGRSQAADGRWDFGFTWSGCEFRVERSRLKLARLPQVALGLFERLGFRVGGRGAVGAGEPRAGIDARDGAMIHVAKFVGLDDDLPSAKRLLPARMFFWSHMRSRSAGSNPLLR